MFRTIAALSVFTVTLFAQRSVPPEFMYHHVWAVVPMVGAGTAADPQRPMFVPVTPVPNGTKAMAQPSIAPPVDKATATQRPELLGYQMQVSDDGKFALVDFVFESPLAFQSFLAKAASAPGAPTRVQALPTVAADGSNIKALATNTATLKAAFESSVPGLKLFERGKASPQDILTAFRLHKANFNFDSSTVRP